MGGAAVKGNSQLVWSSRRVLFTDGEKDVNPSEGKF
jgi:hypothetical protein